MPIKSFPISPDTTPTFFHDAYADDQPYREHAVGVEEIALTASMGALVGAVASIGVGYVSSHEFRSMVNESFFESGTGAPFDGNRLFDDSRLSNNNESHAYDGLLYGAYEPAGANSLPVGVESGTAFTVPEDVVFDVITQSGK